MFFKSKRTEEQEKRIEAMRAEIATMKAEINALQAAYETEAKVGSLIDEWLNGKGEGEEE